MRQVKKDSTSVSVDVYIVDSGDGTPETGVVFDTSGIDLKYRREGATVASITEADLTSPALDDAWAEGGFLAIGNGVYRLDVPDAAFATGVETVVIFGTVTGMVVLPQTIQLVDFDPEDGVRLGLTALPDAAADAIGGLVISDAGGLDIDAMNTAAVRLTAVRAAVLTDWINGQRLDLLLDAIPTTMRGTDNAALATALVTAQTAIDAIPTTVMRGTDSAATASDVLTQAAAALVAIHLDHLFAADYDPASKPGTATALLNELIENNSGVSRYTAGALAQAPAGGGGGDATEAKQDIMIATQDHGTYGFAALKTLIDALNNPSTASIVAGVLAGVIDGSVDLESALKQILSVIVNDSDVSGSSPFVYSNKNAAGDAEVVSQSISADGTSRTTTIP